MHLAATQSSLRGLSLLLASGASIDASDHRGRTPLHAACATGHGNSNNTGDGHLALECIEFLLSAGALEDARDGKGQTALHLTVLDGNLSAARALLAAGATQTADDAGNSPLHLAAAQGHSDIIQLLVVGNREESSPPRKPPTSSDVGGRTQKDRIAAVGKGGFRPVFDVGLSADRKGEGNALARSGESISTTTDGEVCRDDGSVVRELTSQVQHFGAAARDKHSNLPPRCNPEQTSFDRGSHWRYYDGLDTSAVIDGSPAQKDNSHIGSEASSLKLVPKDEDGRLGREGTHGKFQQHRQEGTSSHNRLFEKFDRKESRTSEDDDDGSSRYGGKTLDPEHRRWSQGKGGRRHSSTRQQSRRRRASDRGDRTLSWPEALPAHEYAQVMLWVERAKVGRSMCIEEIKTCKHSTCNLLDNGSLSHC